MVNVVFSPPAVLLNVVLPSGFCVMVTLPAWLVVAAPLAKVVVAPPPSGVTTGAVPCPPVTVVLLLKVTCGVRRAPPVLLRVAPPEPRRAR